MRCEQGEQLSIMQSCRSFGPGLDLGGESVEDSVGIGRQMRQRHHADRGDAGRARVEPRVLQPWIDEFRHGRAAPDHRVEDRVRVGQHPPELFVRQRVVDCRRDVHRQAELVEAEHIRVRAQDT